MTVSNTPAVLTAEWRHLVMANYRIDPERLEPFVPAGTELDFHEGKTWVSVVGFMFLDTRVKGLAIPFHRDFEEINLRFYVRRKEHDEWRRGVVFIREIVPRAAIAFLARKLYNENYIALPTRNRRDTDTEGNLALVRYEWFFRERWNSIEAQVSGAPAPLKEGSEEQFIAEHYWGYATQKDGSTVEYRVEHPSWNVWRVEEATVDVDVAQLYGQTFVEPLAVKPDTVFVADGSSISVSPGSARFGKPA
ncbi:MAG: DUF2071 domain-containing protein [Verrucomicrobiota bacterium]